MKWIYQQPDKKKGDYWFAGRCIATAGISNEISMEELRAIAQDVHNKAFTFGGIDYLQKYVHEDTKRVVWIIDQVTRSSLKNGDHPPEHNYFTILFPEEY
ncbi:hypothetical protein OAF63_03520 [Saprospiraceae bacterium]|nr:hypothetical protein [Saprospiraceae bacterium]